jgi:hypothetical protein
METIQRISLYSYPYLKLAKTPSLLSFVSLQQNWRTRGKNKFWSEVGGGGEVIQIMFTHVPKCKNDNKLKFKKGKE